MDLAEAKFLKKAIIRGGVHMYKASDAVEIISMCEQNRWAILGIDSFIVTKYQTRPLMNHTLDCSIARNENGYWYEAKQFVNDRVNRGYYFEIIYDMRGK
ncbi:hypothetical protein [Azotosporobacter soli]|uniref:hypothetical protein n=1 Tax=Azotosporobacter soli TaxID=3055040 RepID=UPI0031FEE4BC